jgi:hypothetical protein
VKLTTHLNLVPKSRMCRAIPPLPQYIFMVWCLVKHSDNFTFYLLLFKDGVDMTVIICANNLPLKLYHSAEVKLYIHCPQYVFMACCLVKHRDNFTFTFIIQGKLWLISLVLLLFFAICVH